MSQKLSNSFLSFRRLCLVTRARLTKLKSKNKVQRSHLLKLKARDHEERKKKQWRNKEEEGAASSAMG